MELPPLLLTHKRNTKSIVWQYFGLECNEDGNLKDRDMAVCNICLKRISAKGGNTSNLFQHVGVHHPQEYSKIRNKKLTCYGTPRSKDAAVSTPEESRKVISISPAPTSRKRKATASTSSSSADVQVYISTDAGMTAGTSKNDSDGSPKNQRLTEFVTYFLAKELMPPDVADMGGFKRLIQTFDSRYSLPDSSHFRLKSFPSFYSALRSTIATDVEKMSFFSATIDILPNRGGGSYLVFSVHFIDDSWVFKDYCLVSMYLPPEQPVEAIAEGLVSLLTPWNLPPEKLTCVITKESDKLAEVLEYMGWPQLPCFGSRLNHAINSACRSNPEASTGINQCRSLVAIFLQNVDKKRDLWKVKEELGLSDYSLKVDAGGSWLATQEMIKSVLRLEPAIRKVFGDSDEPLLESFPIINGISEALEPITDITEILSSENYVTLSAIKPLLHLLTTSVLLPKEEDHEVTKSLKESISKSLVASYREYRCQVVLNIATHLDPRFKSLFNEPSEAQKIADLIITEGVENFPNINGNDNTENSIPENEGMVKQIEQPNKKRKSLGKLLEELKSASEIDCPPPNTVLKKELDAYLAAPKIDSEANPLVWWSLQASSYPNLAMLARKYLSVCATSAPSEYLFNMKDESPLVHCIVNDPEEVNTALFLSRNLQSNPQHVQPGIKKEPC